MMRFRILLLLAFVAASTPLRAQSEAPAQSAGDGVDPGAQTTLAAPRMDARLLVRSDSVDATTPSSSAWTNAVARPRWRYPAIGAAIGIGAGVIHAYAITRGDYVGIPVEPMYLLPPAYGVAGAFLGLLIDSAERERAARR